MTTELKASARALPAVALIALGVTLVGTAWLCDDAFITFRTVQNLWHGLGLTWNPGQRVQAYTHPAWMFLSALAYGVSGECFFSILGLSLCLTFATALLLVYQTRRAPLLAAGIVLVLSASSAFVQYAVCGLENPLLFFLLALFVMHTARACAPDDLTSVTAISACIALTRVDALLIVGPCCAELALRRSDRWRAAREVSIGAAPLLLWEIFSVIYYGSPVPNTAIAKLNIDVPAEQLYGHGAAYLVNSLQTDPLTLIITVAGAWLLLRSRQRRSNAIVLGLLLYVVYLLRIGGDFMSGRFCGALLVFTLAALSELPRIRSFSARQQGVLSGALLLYAVAWPHSPWHIHLDHGAGLGFRDVVLPNGIADERAYYYPSTGLLPVLLHRMEVAERHWPLPPFPTALRGREFRDSRERVASTCMVGFYGYFAGGKHVVDRCALTDPFLARIPYRQTRGFRPGHFARAEPAGYLDSIVTGHNVIEDRALAELYDEVQLVVSGPLFTRPRWHAIWCLNVGGC